MDWSIFIRTATFIGEFGSGCQGPRLRANGNVYCRDVKAGNLLLDKDGHIELADFGVSSSLMETGERKGVRKTFVGTPCWMAPEVMEPDRGYDEKADIWSFGITSIELAYGQAPFAKFPPMKVLLLTLQNPPPTLERNHPKRKYSRAFKDMVDACLQKDPHKRPSAEKLLQHPFFKQAKKPNYLVYEVVGKLAPLEERARPVEPRRLPTVVDVSAGHTSPPEDKDWDFSTDASPETSRRNSRSKIHAYQIDSAAELSEDSAAPHRATQGTEGVPALERKETKKGRFVVDSVESPKSGSPTHDEEAVVSTSSVRDGEIEVKKGRFMVIEKPGASSSGPGTVNATASAATSPPLTLEAPFDPATVSAGAASELEKKGRFQVGDSAGTFSVSDIQSLN